MATSKLMRSNHLRRIITGDSVLAFKSNLPSERTAREGLVLSPKLTLCN